MSNKCYSCEHYEILKIVAANKPYDGDIPCLRCCEKKKHSEYTKAQPEGMDYDERIFRLTHKEATHV